MNTGDLPEKIRTFVAIFPSSEIVRRLETAQKQLRASITVDAVRWTKPEQIHLTLQFLGYIERDSLGKFESALKSVVVATSGFSLRTESIGCFPSHKRPRIIWAGLGGELELLRALKEKLDAAFSQLGYAPEKREFHAHLTLGRVADLKPTDARRLAQEIARFQSKQFGEVEVREIQLMQSVLSPNGASYRVLNSFSLKKV